MVLLDFLAGLRGDTNLPDWEPGALYVIVSVTLPLGFGILVGYLLKAIERLLGIEIGGGGGH